MVYILVLKLLTFETQDDTDWSKMAIKEVRKLCAYMVETRTHSCSLQGQTIMVIGAAGELPKPPPKPIVFLEGVQFHYHKSFTSMTGLP